MKATAYIIHEFPATVSSWAAQRAPVGMAQPLDLDKIARLALSLAAYDVKEAMIMRHRIQRQPVNIGSGYWTVPSQIVQPATHCHN